MPEPAETESITDDEILFRRIPESQNWYDPNRDLPVSPEAFLPRRHDTTDEMGISLWRAKYITLEGASRGWPGKSYYVAKLRAGDLRRQGIQVVATPHLGSERGHASIPELNYENRKSERVKELGLLLALRLCLEVKGPFKTPAQEGA